MARSIKPSAWSLKMPVGEPSRSRRTSPPEGVGVSRVIPAAFSAAALASPSCPSRRLIHTGLLGVTESIQACRGSGAPRHSV